MLSGKIWTSKNQNIQKQPIQLLKTIEIASHLRNQPKTATFPVVFYSSKWKPRPEVPAALLETLAASRLHKRFRVFAKPMIYIRRPRPTQGGARKGRRGVFPSGRAVWLCFCAVAAAAAANFLQVPCWPRPKQGGARQGIRHFPPTIWKLATAAAAGSRQQQAAVGSSRQSQSHAACTYKGKQQAGSSSNMMFRSPGPACL